MKIAQKFLLIFAGIVFLVAISVLAFVYRSFSGTMESQIRGKLVAVSSYAMEKIDRLLYRRYENIQTLAADPVIRSRKSSKAQITRKLLQFKKHFKKYHPYTSISFFDLRGKRIAAVGGKTPGRLRPFSKFWPGIGAGKEFVLGVSRSGSLNDTVFCFAHAVRDRKGTPLGVVVATLPVEALQMLTHRPLGLFNIGLTPDIDLVDKTGLILYSDHDRGGDLKDTLPNWNVISKAQSAGKANGSLILPDAREKDKEDIVIYTGGKGHAGLGINKWTLVIALPKNAALSPVLRMRNALIVIIVILGFVALSVAYILSRTITKPIIRLSEAAAEIGKGNRDVRVRIDSMDEVGQLGQSFNHMAENLGQTEREREELINELRDALATIRKLEGILPICSCCKKIRDDDGKWNHIETYISRHTDATFTHSLCMDCAKKMYPAQFTDIQKAVQEQNR